MIKDNKFRILTNKNKAVCVICRKPITTERKVRVGVKRCHLSCFKKTLDAKIENLEGWLKMYRSQRNRILVYKDTLTFEELSR